MAYNIKEFILWKSKFKSKNKAFGFLKKVKSGLDWCTKLYIFCDLFV